jgi:hypothetical protein
MTTVAEIRARKAREDSEKIRTRFDTEALQGSKETYARLKKTEEGQKVARAPKSKI